MEAFPLIPVRMAEALTRLRRSRGRRRAEALAP